MASWLDEATEVDSSGPSWLAEAKPVEPLGMGDLQFSERPVEPQPGPPPSLLERVGQVAGGMLLPTKKSPGAALLAALTGGRSEQWNAPGAYTAMDSPPAKPRMPGESLQDYVKRTVNDDFEYAKTDEAQDRMMLVAGLGLGGASGKTQAGQPRVTTKPPRIATTPAAQVLLKEGVDLTAGQRNPGSVLGQIEAASADNWLGMKPEREAARQGFMRAAQDKGVAPGAPKPTQVDPQARLSELFDGYGQAYDKVRQKPVPPEAVASLPDAAAMPRRGVDARTSAGVKAEVENALTVLGDGILPPKPAHSHGGAPTAPQGLLDAYGRPIPPAPKPLPKATAGDLMKVRENIREQVRAARQSQDFDKLRLLEEAEDVVSEALQKALTPDEAAHLAATDRQYARLMTAANAAPAGQTTFTPGQYLRQVERSAGRRTFKKGAAGDLQDLGEAARDVIFDAPYTGGRVAVLSQAPGLKYMAAGISRLANTQRGKKFLFEPRSKGPPRIPRDAEAYALINALRGQGTVAPRPVWAGEEEP